VRVDVIDEAVVGVATLKESVDDRDICGFSQGGRRPRLSGKLDSGSLGPDHYDLSNKYKCERMHT
jgi:hypothetical protein